MAWRYPQYPITPQAVLDIDPINENFLVVAGEVSGNLNEHNLSANSLNLTRDQMADDAAFRLHTSIPDPVPSVIASVPAVKIGILNTDWLLITGSTGWQVFPGAGSRMDFVCKGGTVWICASFNVYCNQPRVIDSMTPEQRGFGYNFALRLDGSVLYETLLGTGDPTNEDYRNQNLATIISTELDMSQGGGGISGVQFPVVLDAVVELLPGAHSLEFAVQNIRGSMRELVTSPQSYISTREMFALELLT